MLSSVKFFQHFAPMAVLSCYLCVVCSCFELASLYLILILNFSEKQSRILPFYSLFIIWKEKANSDGSVFEWLIVCELVVLEWIVSLRRCVMLFQYLKQFHKFSKHKWLCFNQWPLFLNTIKATRGLCQIIFPLRKVILSTWKCLKSLWIWYTQTFEVFTEDECEKKQIYSLKEHGNTEQVRKRYTTSVRGVIVYCFQEVQEGIFWGGGGKKIFYLLVKVPTLSSTSPHSAELLILARFPDPDGLWRKFRLGSAQFSLVIRKFQVQLKKLAIFQIIFESAYILHWFSCWSLSGQPGANICIFTCLGQNLTTVWNCGPTAALCQLLILQVETSSLLFDNLLKSW